MAGFRRSVWDPLLLLLQMLAMQCLFYGTLGLLLLLITHAIDGSLSLELVFSPKVSWQRCSTPAFLR